MSWLSWLKRKPRAKLVVVGVITETGRHTPRTHLGPVQASEQAYLSLDIETAGTTDGDSLQPKKIQPSEFSGDVSLLERFAVGQRVSITCQTLTGREIESIDATL